NIDNWHLPAFAQTRDHNLDPLDPELISATPRISVNPTIQLASAQVGTTHPRGVGSTSAESPWQSLTTLPVTQAVLSHGSMGYGDKKFYVA
ncbi:unnamed protein product, partial [Mycena citricolor]